MEPENKPETPDQRRRFLRETLKGSVPLLFGWIAGRARGLIHTLGATPTPAQTSPPPAAATDVPPAAKQAADRHYDEFVRDNPDRDPFRESRQGEPFEP